MFHNHTHAHMPRVRSGRTLIQSRQLALNSVKLPTVVMTMAGFDASFLCSCKNFFS